MDPKLKQNVAVLTYMAGGAIIGVEATKGMWIAALTTIVTWALIRWATRAGRVGDQVLEKVEK